MSELPLVLLAAGSRLESFGHLLVERFGLLNFWTAALLGGALVLDRALSRRAQASLRIALYAPVGLRVLLPLDWSARLFPSAPAVDAFFITPPLQLFGTRAAVEASAGHTLSWYALAAVTYVVVAALLAARAVLSRVRLDRALAGTRPVRDAHPGVPCPIVQHDDLGPMAVGVLAPRIVLPDRLLAPGEEHTLACVLRHEAAHLRRRDAWLSTAMQTLAIVAWPVVPLWIAIARVRQLVELACDEAALAGADATERRRYGHALLDLAGWRSLAVAPLGAGELHFGSTLRARIEALASQRHWPMAAQAIALSVAPIVLLFACSRSQPASIVATTSAPASGEDDTGYGYEFEADSTNATSPETDLSRPHAMGDRIPPETVQAIVRGHFPAFKSCYDAGLRRDPKLTGTVTVKCVAGADGVTKEAADEGSTLPDKEVVACVAGEFGKLTYPKGGGMLTFIYPIQLAP
jgi:beta-lactamase regulating signal transducer with metallopeptidase domain